jgi:hypothetical protein
MATTGIVRPFHERDIPYVAELHRTVFGIALPPSETLERNYHPYLTAFIPERTTQHPQLHSLVYEDRRDGIIGFLGVKPQPMRMRETSIQAAVSSQFVVDARFRSTMAGIQLLRTFLAGPQDLSIADEASPHSQSLWRGLGGSTASFQSISWARVLRPAQFWNSRMDGQPSSRLWNAMMKPALRLGDRLLTAMPGNPFHLLPTGEFASDPSMDELLSCIREVSLRRTLRPVYEFRSFERMLSTLDGYRKYGPLRIRAIRNSRGKIEGWFIYHAKHGGLGEVLQVGATESAQGRILDQLFLDAWQQGVAALSGRLQEDLLEDLRRRKCLFHHRGYWTLVHSRNREILDIIHRGDAWLTRLEGEWPMRFEIPAMESAAGSRSSICSSATDYREVSQTAQ